VVKEGKHARGGNWHVSGGTENQRGVPLMIPSRQKMPNEKTNGPNHVGYFRERESLVAGGQPRNNEQQVYVVAGTSDCGGFPRALDVFECPDQANLVKDAVNSIEFSPVTQVAIYARRVRHV